MHKTSEFRKLLAASFISQTGSHFLTLAIASFVLYTSGSPVQSALIFVVSFLPSILVSAKLGHWVDTRISRWLIARNELISVAATLLSGLSISLKMPLFVLCVILGLRSLLMFISRAAAMKWLKLISPPELQTTRIKLYNLSFFLSTAISGLLAGFVLSHASIWMVVLLDATSFVLGVGVLMTLEPLALRLVEATPQADVLEPSLRHTLAMIFTMPAVRVSFLVVCLSQAIFQGTYSVLVSYLPIQVFKLGLGGVGAFQLAASIGITTGFLIIWFRGSVLSERLPTRPLRAMIAAAVAASALLTVVAVTNLAASLVAFFVLNLAYECVWLHHSSDFFRASPKASAARYQFTLSACAAFLMASSTLAYSALVQYAGVVTASILILALGALLAIALPLLGRRAELLPQLERATQ